VLEAVRALQAAGHQAFLVGGCVRDMLRGAKAKDFDVATSALPAQVKLVFKKVHDTGIAHGTVTVHSKGAQVEVTTFRSEGAYLDGRRPSEVSFHTDVEADLSRRDFTINAIALDPVTGALVDPFGGQADLQARLVRCVGKALDRFTEDGLRCLRAVRFSTVLDFTLDPQTEAAIPLTIPVFRKVAIERVREEFLKVLGSPHVLRGLTLLRSTGLLEEFLPEAQVVSFAAIPLLPADADARLAVVLAGSPVARGALERLKLPTKSVERISGLIAHRQPPSAGDTDKVLRLWLRDVGPEPESLAQQLAVCAALGGNVQAVASRLEKLRSDPLVPRQLALNGGEIMAALGVPPGPAVGEATRFLMDLVLDDPSKNTKDSLRAALSGFRP
jgi:tRNA nucleotidyltransferase (CCA-adding enzyme)